MRKMYAYADRCAMVFLGMALNEIRRLRASWISDVFLSNLSCVLPRNYETMTSSVGREIHILAKLIFFNKEKKSKVTATLFFLLSIQYLIQKSDRNGKGLRKI